MASVVTGASSGIGRGVAHRLSALGRVVVVGRRAAGLEETRRSAPRPENVVAVAGDVADADMGARVLAALGGEALRFAVHSAAGEFADNTDILAPGTEEAVRRAADVNTLPLVTLTRALLPAHTASTRVLFVSTGYAVFAAPLMPTYSVTKAAQNMVGALVDEALRLRGLGMAGGMRPGIVDTEMQQRLRSLDGGVGDKFKQVHAEGLLRSVAEVARFIDFILLSMGDDEFSAHGQLALHEIADEKFAGRF